MKILITDIHHGNGGGHVTYVLSLLKGLKTQYDLTVAAPPTGRLYQAASAEPGVRVLPGLYTSRPLTLLKEVWRLRQFLRQERFDVVHVNGGADHRHVMLASLGLRHRPAIVWTKHNTNPVCSVGHRLRARFGTHASIAVCEYVARILGESGYSRHPISVVRNGIDHNHLRPVGPADKQAHRDRLFGPLDSDVLVLGSIGGTDYNKGWLDLVQAISRLEPPLRSRLRMVVAGDPPTPCMLARVDSLAMREQVVFPGLVKDVRTVLGACDIGFVLSYREAASYASCETMAMGLPALVSNAGGLPENVRDGVDGWVAPAGDIDFLADALRRILADTRCLSAMGRSARERVEHMFSTPGFIEDTKKVYAQADRLARDLPAPI
ncbi:glycosyltransferase family 4 protein [Pollutimonas sp. M17]|uniref:glycosyltransferase family 4 protein n=1 Tax=Pollutimonas sp. M17 TaxID=2962065 RepID=UPI0021F4D244|nr:glycosyltransferase family 4 protein [Pollutimonas sp. M17]UYO92572.1 glycosyltransferase family 4 protein [Pollutimonas sp. M17]